MEFAELPPSTNKKVNEDLKSRDEVQQFIQFIEEMKVDKTDYTAKKWREIFADPDDLIGFGKPGDWYQFVQQKCNALSFFDGISTDKSSKKLLQHVELLNIVKSNSGPNPNAFDWFNVTEMFDIDPPKFNECQVTVTFKINTNNGAHVILHVNSCHWDRHSSEGDKMGPCGKMNVTVVESTVKELQQFNGIIVLRHDATDLTDDDETPDEPVSLSISFFTKLAKILSVPKTSFVKFVFDTCQYPFTKCDWKNEIEQKKSKHVKQGDQYTKRFQYIKEEIMEKMPNTMQIFEKGYADIDDHICLLGYLQRFIHWKIRNLHCQEMMALALSEDRYFDFSSAKDLVSNTAWFTVTDNYSKYSIDVSNAKGNSEFTLLVETIVDTDEYDDEDEIISIKISLLNVQNRLKKKIVKIFQPYANGCECEEEKCSIKINEDEEFLMTSSFAHFAKHNAVEQSILLEIMKLMHLNWNHDQFMKFLVEMACLEEDQTSFDYSCDVSWASEFFIDVAKESEHNQTMESEDYSRESADDGEDTLMDLDQELNDIKMELDPDILNTHGRRVRRVRNPSEPQMSDSSDESDECYY